jgi:hypothetical protein
LQDRRVAPFRPVDRRPQKADGAENRRAADAAASLASRAINDYLFDRRI